MESYKKTCHFVKCCKRYTFLCVCVLSAAQRVLFILHVQCPCKLYAICICKSINVYCTIRIQDNTRMNEWMKEKKKERTKEPNRKKTEIARMRRIKNEKKKNTYARCRTLKRNCNYNFPLKMLNTLQEKGWLAGWLTDWLSFTQIASSIHTITLCLYTNM